jgi:iron complex outermembrane receptor protein
MVAGWEGHMMRSMHARKWFLGTASLFALTGGLAGSAHSQDAPATAQPEGAAAAQPEAAATAQPSGAASPAAGEDTIVVTAQRREQSLMEVPQAVQALTGDSLTRTGINDISSTIQLIPGATISAKFGAGNQVYQMRGVATGETAGDPSVGYYLDSFAFNLPGRPYAPVADLYDLQRVEVIRGPSGTLYGFGSLGGTIKVLTNDADPDNFAGSARMTLSATSGGSPSGSADAMLNIPIVEGRLAIRGVFSYETIGGYAPLVSGPDNVNDRRAYTGRIKLLARPSDDLTIRLAYWRNHSAQNFCDRMTFLNPPRIDQTKGICDSGYSLLSGDLEYNLGPATIQSSTGYLRSSVNVHVAGFVPFPTGHYQTAIPLEIRSFVEDARIVSNGSGPFSYIFGVFYQNASDAGGQDNILLDTLLLPGNVGLIQVGSLDKLFTRSYALYGQGTYSFGNGLVDLTVGGRYFHDNRRFNQNNQSIQISKGITTTTTSTVRATNESFSPRFNVAFHPGDNRTIYAEVAKGFRSGSIIPNSILVPANAALGTNYANSQPPDTLWNYEVGVKWPLIDNHLRLELAAYRFDWGGAQVGIQPAGTTIIVPIGDVRAYGLDLSLAWRTPIRGLDIQLTGNVNHTRLHNVPPGLTARRPFLADGNQLAGTSKDTFAAVANYETPLSGSGLHLRANARYSYRGPQQSLFNGQIAPSINLIGGRIGVGTDAFDVSLFVENLTNEVGPLAINGAQYLIPFPRQIGITGEFRF